MWETVFTIFDCDLWFAIFDCDLWVEDISAFHQKCKNNVPKFVAAQALYTPLRPNEQRPKVVETAKQFMQSFSGILTSKMNLRCGFGKFEGSLLIDAFLFIVTCSF